MKIEKKYSKLEEIVYLFGENDIEEACKARIENIKTHDNRFRIVYGDCGEFKGVEIRVLMQKEIR